MDNASKLNLLLLDKLVIVPLKSRTLVYKDKEIVASSAIVLNHPKVFNNKIYDYSNDKLTSFTVEDNDSSFSIIQKRVEDFKFGQIIDFHKFGQTFIFLKLKNSKFSLHSKSGLIVTGLEFDNYCFSEDVFAFSHKNLLSKINLNTKEISIIKTYSFQIQNFIFDEKMIAVTSITNKLFLGERSYHWLNKKATKLIFVEDSVIAVNNQGASQFYSRINKIAPLFTFNGIFYDIKAMDNLVVFLSDIELIIFDLTTNNVIYKRYLIEMYSSYISFTDKSAIINDFNETDDVFKAKKKSYIEIKNSISESSTKFEGLFGLLTGSNLALFENTSEIISLYQLPSVFNYLNNDCLISLDYRRSTIIITLYAILQNRLILADTKIITRKPKVKIENAFFIRNKIYLQEQGKCFLLNEMGILEEIGIATNIISSYDLLLKTDEKGILDLIKNKYLIKEKNIQCIMPFKKYLIFYIPKKGLFISSACDSYINKDFICNLPVINLIEQTKNTFLVSYHDNGVLVYNSYKISDLEGEECLKIQN